MATLPQDFSYSEDHEWVNATADAVAGATVRICITSVAADRLGEVVFAELPEVGDTVTAGTPIIAVEAQKLRERGVNLITPVVCPTAKQVAGIDIAREGHALPSEVAATIKRGS